MAEIGKINKLRIARSVDFGVYVDGENLGEILVPRQYVPEDAQINDMLDVFIFFDSEDRIIATTTIPYATVGEFAYLEAISVTTVGSFLDWGLQKDLFVPYREQKKPLIKGNKYLVYIYFDEKSGRIAASPRLDKFIKTTDINYEEGEMVDLIIRQKTDLGIKAIINNTHEGILYENETFKHLSIGQHIPGFIKKVRADKKIDLVLQKPGFQKVDDLFDNILSHLKENKGISSITDKSEPEIIYELFGVSKKTYKKALGALYKRKMITIETDVIKLVPEKNSK